MIEALRDLRTELTRLRTALPRPGSSQVRAPTLKRKFRDIVDTYFRHTRQDMASGGLQDDQLGILDALMQQLLDFSNRSVASSTCKKNSPGISCRDFSARASLSYQFYTQTPHYIDLGIRSQYYQYIV